jgi:hypothetical protein
MSISDQFHQFLSNIQPTQAQKEDADKKHTSVCKTLHSHYYTDKYSGTTCVIIGSYGKATNIRPPRDVDVLFIMPASEFSKYHEYKTNGQSQLLQDIRRLLGEHYSTTDKIRGWGEVVLIEFPDGTHNVELLPAWRRSDGQYTIPSTEKGGHWDIWDPVSEKQVIDQSDRLTNGRTRAVIKMVKKWSETCSVPVHSYQIEEAAVSFFADYTKPTTDYSVVLRDFFDYFRTKVKEESRSHVETAYSRAEKANDLEHAGDLDEAAQEWKKVFGPDFPSVGEEETASKSMPVLADSSHCEPLRWPHIAQNSVKIIARVLSPNKEKRLGGIASNGRSVIPGLYLEFTADTDTNGAFDYYWQVVNTGEVAKRANDLRGTFFTGGKMRQEHTEYSGKHWIECFIVKGDICVARSGRFFVNIG